jgi:2-succinyl-6-hydroxy-2,4-cyclohexadiene-1-carboxylate synthase
MQGAGAWSEVVERIGRSYRARALEHRAHDFEGRVAEIESAAPPGAAIVGYSLGGRLCLHAALRTADRPDRFGALVTVGANAGIDNPMERSRRRAADEELAAWIERSPIEAVVDRWEGNPALVGQPRALVAAQRPDRLRHEPTLLAALLRSAGQGACPPVWERLGEVEMPLLAVAGERDPQYVAAAERMAAATRHGRAATIPGAGHAAHLERPDAFAAVLLEFLDEHLGQRGVVDRDP